MPRRVAHREARMARQPKRRNQLGRKRAAREKAVAGGLVELLEEIFSRP